ncbi:polysaccharide pyruvyl transferase family protein [Paenibacillus sp. Marseille-Q4541]|uniref:polysaccharide pyruvyl transferase family protein n=1 Tax=Paenibacillus sp. Marseille-Q4541 TaxID=2831522 RepID=UPI001BAB7D81|nr:polysaccharide pyruvyl transferase family protein [Paenibacillus sp. Marseille-Q4541]
MKIAASGYYGMGNFGDDLFLKTLQQAFHHHEVFPWNAYMDTNQVDAVIVGGGDLITPYKFSNYYFPKALQQHPMWLYGVGIVDTYPPETWPEEEVNKHKEYFQHAQRAIFRDKTSAELAAIGGFHKNPETAQDMVFAYQEHPFPVKRFSLKKTIGVCLFSYPSFPFETMTELLLNLNRQNYHIVLIPVINHPNNSFSDYNTCKKLEQAMKAADPAASVQTLSLLLEIDLTYNIIQSMDYLISYKLHPTLVALRAGVPVLAMSKMGKVKHLLERFHLEHFYCDFSAPLASLEPIIRHFLKEGPSKVKENLPLIRLAEEESTAELQQLVQDLENYKRFK